MSIGTGLLILATALGWSAGRHRALPPVRLIGWWVRLVVAPLIRSPSWPRRSATIFLNNAAVLAVIVALGRWLIAAYASVTVLGLSLGLGLRILAGLDGDLAVHVRPGRPHVRRKLIIGVALNLLEPPAIVLALGLSLGRQTAPLDESRVWSLFATWVVPLLVLAAVGEGLWLGAGQEKPPPQDALAAGDSDGRQGR